MDSKAGIHTRMSWMDYDDSMLYMRDEQWCIPSVACASWSVVREGETISGFVGCLLMSSVATL